MFRSVADVNRFGARYRVANSFQRLVLDGFTDNVARGYDALTRLMLMWSAFEGFIHAAKTKRQDLSARLDHAPCLADLRAIPAATRYLAFVLPRLKHPAQIAEVEKFVRGEPCCTLTLAAAVRHIFVHSALTPSSDQVEPGSVIMVCDRLSLLVRRVIDREFSERVAELVEMFPAAAADPDVPF